MNNNYFNEGNFLPAYRFLDPHCRLSDIQKSSIHIIDTKVSIILWQNYISKYNKHLFKINNDDIINKFTFRKVFLQWDKYRVNKSIFNNELHKYTNILFFWGPNDSCILDVKTFVKGWDDFFYPSDENSVLIALGNKLKYIYSFEDYFFFSE